MSTHASILVKERILAAAAAAPSPTRRQGRRAAYLLFMLAAAMALGFFELAGGVAHSRDRPLGVTVHLADGLGLASALLTWLVARRSVPFLQAREAVAAATLACPAALVLWMGWFHGTYAEPPPVLDWPCLLGTLAMAAPPLAALLWIRRGVEPHHPGVLGGALGCASGAWAGMLTLLWCPSTEPHHALVGHVVPILLLSMVGSVVGSRALAMETKLPR